MLSTALGHFGSSIVFYFTVPVLFGGWDLSATPLSQNVLITYSFCPICKYHMLGKTQVSNHLYYYPFYQWKSWIHKKKQFAFDEDIYWGNHEDYILGKSWTGLCGLS